MGINKLLSSLKFITKPKHIQDYAGLTVAVDTYCWLHKSIYTCTLELGQGLQSDKFLHYCVRRIEMLLSNKIKKIVMVFDGGKIPMKLNEENERKQKREDNKQKAQSKLEAGDLESAKSLFAQSIDVTPQMAYKLIKMLENRENIECIVSPFEADAQLAYLSKIDYVDVVITEDSDLLALGAKRILYKLNDNGTGEEICIDDLFKSQQMNFSFWNYNMFLAACIIMGCDYSEQVASVGFSTAYKLVSEHRNIQKLLYSLKRQGKYKLRDGYEQTFEQAFLTFRFYKVYCPVKKKLVQLNDFDVEKLKKRYLDKDTSGGPEEQQNWSYFENNILEEYFVYKIIDSKYDWSFLGQLDEETALQIATMQIDPETRQPYKEEQSLQIDLIKKQSISKIMPLPLIPINKTKQYFNISKPANQQYDKGQNINGKQISITNYFRSQSCQEINKEIPLPQQIDFSNQVDETYKSDMIINEQQQQIQVQAPLLKKENSNQQTQQLNQNKNSLDKQMLEELNENVYIKTSKSLNKPFKPPSIAKNNQTSSFNSNNNQSCYQQQKQLLSFELKKVMKIRQQQQESQKENIVFNEQIQDQNTILEESFNKEMEDKISNKQSCQLNYDIEEDKENEEELKNQLIANRKSIYRLSQSQKKVLNDSSSLQNILDNINNSSKSYINIKTNTKGSKRIQIISNSKNDINTSSLNEIFQQLSQEKELNQKHDSDLPADMQAIIEEQEVLQQDQQQCLSEQIWDSKSYQIHCSSQSEQNLISFDRSLIKPFFNNFIKLQMQFINQYTIYKNILF